MSDGDPIEEFWSLFGAELDEYLSAIEAILAAGRVDPGRVDELFRAFHSVKGGSAALALRCIETVAHAAEDVLHLVRAGKRDLSTDLVSALLEAVDEMRRLQGTAMETRTDQPVNAAIVARLKSHMGDGAQSSPPPLPPSVLPGTAGAEPPGKPPAGEPALAVGDAALEAIQDAVLGLLGTIDAEDPSDTAAILAEAADAAGLCGIADSARRLTAGDRWGWLDLTLRLRGVEAAGGGTVGAFALSAALEVPFADLLLEHTGTLRDEAGDPAAWMRAARLLTALELDTGAELADLVVTRLLSGDRSLEQDDAERDELTDLCALIGISASSGMEMPHDELAALRTRWFGGAPAAAGEDGDAIAEATGRAHPWPPDTLAAMAEAAEAGCGLVLVLLDLESDPDAADAVSDRMRAERCLYNRSRLDLGAGLFEHVVALARTDAADADAFALALYDADPAGRCVRAIHAASPAAEEGRALGRPAAGGPVATAAAAMAGAADMAAAPLSADRAAPASEAAPPAARPADATVRVPSAAIDGFMDVIGELRLGLTSLATMLEDRPGRPAASGPASGQAPGSASDAARALRDELRRMDRAVRQLYDGAIALRVVPIGGLFTRLMRPIRDTAVLVGKEVGLTTSGEDVQVDKAMIEMLVDPLTHIVRNSVDHGIETPGRRLAAGKPAAGSIRIRARQTASLAIVEVADDGGGIDTARVRAKAVAKGLIGAREAEALPEAEALNLILLPGFSTRDEVTATSGRGVGMDIVLTAIRKLGGRLSIDSHIGQGTRMTIEFPVSAAMQRVLAVEAAGQTLALHERTVREVVDVPAGGLRRIGRRLTLSLHGRFLPVVDLAALLDLRPPVFPAASPAASPAAPDIAAGRCVLVVVDDGQAQVGLRVDRVAARREVFFKRLHPLIARNPLVAGAAAIGAGGIMFALDTQTLFERAAAWAEPDPDSDAGPDAGPDAAALTMPAIAGTKETPCSAD
ncbi:chemotaxis protein CheA [Azospirillum thiophilum]|uniref:chemotaxis protein CheA n=1 Tax=Azospirillum thiophilum TaxID=528244 RepID=UPI00069613B8|nr:ATP-binding protein [Azospirillum thiophilum]